MREIERLRARSIETAGGCWEWQGYRTRHGYGRIKVAGRMTTVNRAAWAATNGPIPVGLWVLHSCDNPPCWNPAHLRLGTARDNTADMRARGRAVDNAGEANGVAKLTWATVTEIRRRFSAGETNRAALGRQFGVTDRNIAAIVSGKTWRSERAFGS